MGLLDEREEDDNIVGGDDNDDDDIMMTNHDDDNDDIRLFRTCFFGTVEQKVFTHTLVRVPDLFPNL